jgi:nucleotide-binding universal stress UspA family protein
MKPFLNILVGINYTRASRHALVKAATIGAENGAKITAMHVLPLTDLSDYVNFYQIEHKNLLEEARQCLVDFVDEVLGPDHGVICEVGEGSPRHEISGVTNENHYDLLVLGDGDDTEDLRDVGQFAIRCLRFVEVPVLVVNQADARPSPPVAACLDFSDSTKPILENALSLVADRSLPMELIHSCRPPWLRSFLGRLRNSGDEESGQKEQFREVIDGSLKAIEQQARDLGFENVSSTRLESADVDRALSDHLTSRSYSLVVLGRNGAGVKGLLSDVVGSTANDLIRQARCPVLIVPLES